MFLEDAEPLLNFAVDREPAKEMSDVHRSLSYYIKGLSAQSSFNKRKTQSDRKRKVNANVLTTARRA